MTKQKILYLDLETSPNIGTFWRPGNKVSLSPANILEERQIILASYAWNSSKPQTVSWKKDSKSSNKYLQYSDESVVKKLVNLCNEADVIVAHNAQRFDLPWLRARAMYYGITLDHNLQVFDTLKKTRGLLGLNSYKLDYLGKFFVADKKVETGGFGLWLGCMAGCKNSMAKMKKYCEQDVALLRKYYLELIHYVPALNHAGAVQGKGKWTCKTCGSHQVRLRKQYYTAAGNPRFNMTCENNHNYVISATEYKKFLNES